MAEAAGMERRVRYVNIEGEFLVTMFSERPEHKWVRHTGLPADAELVAMDVNLLNGHWVSRLLVRSATFRVVEDGDTIPETLVLCTSRMVRPRIVTKSMPVLVPALRALVHDALYFAGLDAEQADFDERAARVKEMEPMLALAQHYVRFNEEPPRMVKTFGTMWKVKEKEKRALPDLPELDDSKFILEEMP